MDFESYSERLKSELKDNNQWLADINSESPLEMVIRGHLWIESQIIKLLEEILPFPERIDLGRFSFPQKVALASAHGYIPAEDVPAYLKLNSLRNKVAHDLQAALGPNDERDLINCLGSAMRDIVVRGVSEKSLAWPEGMRYVMATLIMSTHAWRLRFLMRQEEIREENARLREISQSIDQSNAALTHLVEMVKGMHRKKG